MSDRDFIEEIANLGKETIEQEPKEEAIVPEPIITKEEVDANGDGEEISAEEGTGEAVEENGEGQEEGEAEEIEANEGSAEEKEEEVGSKPNLVVSVGDEEFEIPADAVFKWETKAGEEASASLEELKSDYWGKKEITRRFTEIDRIYKDQLDPYRKNVEQLHKLEDDLKNLDGDELVLYVFEEVAKQNPKVEKAMRSYCDRLYAEAEALVKLSPEDQKRYLIEKENETLRREKENSQKKESQETTNKHVMDQYTNLGQKYEVDANFVYRVGQSLIKSNVINDKMSLDEAFKEIERGLVDSRHYNKAADIIEKLDPNLIKDDKVMNEALFLSKNNPDLSVAELEKKLASLYGKPTGAKKVKPKARKKLINKRTKIKNEQKPNLVNPAKAFMERAGLKFTDNL